jgi:uncharacterized protein involved in type VI secretion and phage assembly
VTTQANRYYGKYRGTVVNNLDPMQQARIQAKISGVLDMTNWADACVPFAGNQSGVVCVPPVGSGVWIEFEAGDLNKPIWTGGWWGSAAEVPALALTTPPTMSKVVMQTMGQTTFMINDDPSPAGGILLKTAAGALISINSTGITISNGQGASIVMSGPTVTVNAGALTVT